MAADLIDDFLIRLQAHHPAAAAAIASQLEAELRQHWGGTERHYIRKRPAAEQRTQRIALGLQEGLAPAESFVLAGVSRATGFRHMKKKWKVTP